MDILFQKMISALSRLEPYLLKPRLKTGNRASEVKSIRLYLDKNIGRFLGINNPTVEDDVEYIMSFNNFIRDEDFGLDEPDLLSILIALSTEEEGQVVESMQQVIERSESIMSRYQGNHIK